MPLFRRLRALSLKHFGPPPHYVRHYVHAGGGKETEGTERLKYTTSALLFPIGLKLKSFEVRVVFRRIIYVSGIWQHSNPTAQASRTKSASTKHVQASWNKCTLIRRA